MDIFSLPAIPGEFQWRHPPADWKVAPDHSLIIVAGEKTDWFIDPAGLYTSDNAPGALFTPPDTHFLLSARVRVDFASAFDAGAIQILANEALWAKLCFEYSPQQQPMIVSVVTRGISDDCNSAVIQGQEVYLRIAVTLQTIAFHYSLDGHYWNFVRYFSLGNPHTLAVGFSAQSPTGKQCQAVFSEISYQAGTLQENRNGE